MLEVSNRFAEHPIDQSPYNLIRYVRLNGQKVRLYAVEGATGEVRAEEALRRATRLKGARCFHCDRKIARSGKDWGVDHLHPLALGGSRQLYNLVIACIHCNSRKSNRPLEQFDLQRSAEYLLALQAHIERCLRI